MARRFSANEIINRAASEIGLEPVPSTFSVDSFRQLRYLLDSAGQEMVEMFHWPVLNKTHQITTAALDTGDYDLPLDFAYMIEQTGWDRSNNLPLAGPLSAQNWTYVLGRDLLNTTIYASFRMRDSKFSIFPQPPPVGLDINFEYISRNWIVSADGLLERDVLVEESDYIKFEPILMIKLLKAKYLEAKGFDSTAARREFGRVYDAAMGHSESAPMLNAAGTRRSVYLDTYRNTPDTGYGS
jgi:hypothetical protein